MKNVAKQRISKIISAILNAKGNYYKNCPEYSRSRSGFEAVNYLKELKNSIEDDL